MSQFTLEMTISNVQYLLDQSLKKLSQKRSDAELFLDIAGYYRYLGAGNFLLELNIDNFFRSLFKGANVYLELLNLKETYSFDPYYLCKSKGLPFLDAIAINAFDLANEISGKTVKTWQRDMEYEEDFYYYNTLAYLLKDMAENKNIEKEINKFAACLDGDDSIRLNLVTAIYEKSEEAFQENIYELIQEWEDLISRQRKSDKIDPYFDKTTANIFIEGIALVRLAQQHGIKTENQYNYIPDLILQNKADNFSLK